MWEIIRLSLLSNICVRCWVCYETMKMYILFTLSCLIGTTLSAHHHKSVHLAHEEPSVAIDGYVNGYYTFLGHQLPVFLNKAHTAFTGIESANKPAIFHQDFNSDGTAHGSLLSNHHGELSQESSAYSQHQEILNHNPIGFNSVVGAGGNIEVFGHGRIHLKPIMEKGVTGDLQVRNRYTGRGIGTETFSNLNDMEDVYQTIDHQRGLNQVANGEVYDDSQSFHEMFVEGDLSTGQETNLEAEGQAGYQNIALEGDRLTNLNSYSNGENYQDAGLGPNVLLGGMDYGDSSIRGGKDNKMSMNLAKGISTKQRTRQVLRKVNVNTPSNGRASNPKRITKQQKYVSSNQERINFDRNRVFNNQYPDSGVNRSPVGTQRGYKSSSGENANIANQDVVTGYTSNSGTGQISNERGLINNRRAISSPNYGLQNQMDYPETEVLDQNYYIDESAFENSMGVAPSQTSYGSEINQGSMMNQQRGDSTLKVSKIKPVEEEPEHDATLCKQNHPHEEKPILESSSNLEVAGRKKLDLSPVVEENIKDIFGADKPQTVRENVRNLNNDATNSYSTRVQSNKVARKIEKESVSMKNNYGGRDRVSSNQNVGGLRPLRNNQINGIRTVKDTITTSVSSQNSMKTDNGIDNSGYISNQENQMGVELVSNENRLVGQNGYGGVSTGNQVNPRVEVSSQRDTKRKIFSDINTGGIYQTGSGFAGYENSVAMNSKGELSQTPQYPIYGYQPVINVNKGLPPRTNINRLIPYPIQGGLNRQNLQRNNINGKYSFQSGLRNQYPLQSGYRRLYPTQTTRGVLNGRYLNSGIRRLPPSRGGLFLQYPRLQRRFPLQRVRLVNNRLRGRTPLLSLSSRFKEDESDQEEMITGVDTDYGSEDTVFINGPNSGDDEIVAEAVVEDEYGPEAVVFGNIPTSNQDEYEPGKENSGNILVGTQTDSIEPESQNDKSGTGTLLIEPPVVVANASVDGNHNEESNMSNISQEQNVTEDETTEQHTLEQVDGASGNSSESESSVFHTKETTQVVGNPQKITFTIKLPPKIITTKTVTNLENHTIEQNPMEKSSSIVASRSQDGIQITIGNASFSLNEHGNESHFIDLSSRTGIEQGYSKNDTGDGVESTSGNFNGIVSLSSQRTGQYSNDNVTKHNISVDDQMFNDSEAGNYENVNLNLTNFESSIEPKEKDISFGYRKISEFGQSGSSADLQESKLKVPLQDDSKELKQDDTLNSANDGQSGGSYEDSSLGYDASSVTDLRQKGLEEEIYLSKPNAGFDSDDNHYLEKETRVYPNVLDFRHGGEYRHHGHHHPILNLARKFVNNYR